MKNLLQFKKLKPGYFSRTATLAQARILKFMEEEDISKRGEKVERAQ